MYTPGANPIDNTADTLDSRDVIARIDWLASAEADDYEGYEDDERDASRLELESLRAFAAEGETDAQEWADGAILIREDYFVNYAENYADEIGAYDSEATWPTRHIDWEAAADELREDYSVELTFDGVTYICR